MDTSSIDAFLQSWVDAGQLPGASYTVLRGAEVVARGCVGWADVDSRTPLGEQHLFRIFSNTKLLTSIAALQLVERGLCSPDQPVGDVLPPLAQLRVLRPGAKSVDDTEPLREPVRLRHLLTHTAGFTYGFLDPGSFMAKAYAAARVADPARDLAGMVDALGTLPLLFQPGSAWNYSVATDVAGRLVEVVSGQRLDAYLQQHILDPLGLEDTMFFVPPDQAGRLATLYVGDLREPQRGGLRVAQGVPYEGAYLRPVPRLNGGGGLVSSLADYTALVRALLLGGAPLLRPETMPLLLRNQLPAGMWIGCPGIPGVEGRGHSLAGSVTVHESPADPAGVEGELQWGGLAGTKWMLSPRENLAVVLMTQRHMASDLPYWPRFQQAVRAALGA